MALAKNSSLNEITVSVAELIRASEGCHYDIFEFEVKKILFEGDAIGVIKWIQGSFNKNGYAAGPLRDIWDWKDNLNDLMSLSYSKRR